MKFKDPLFPYKLLAIRMKISYHSCAADVSIKELFLSAIIRSADAMVLETETQENKSVNSMDIDTPSPKRSPIDKIIKQKSTFAI